MQFVILIGPPDSSLKLAASVLGRRKRIARVPPGRLLTALAHVGISANIDKAAYDHVLAGPAQRQFLQRVEGGIDAWPLACRAYIDALLDAASATIDEPYLLDSAPEYARLWPFIHKVMPESQPIVLIRNPVATAAEVLARSEDARDEAHLLETWHQIVRLVRESGDARILRYENLVLTPEAELSGLADQFGKKSTTITTYDGQFDAAAERETAWPHELVSNPLLLRRVRRVLERVPVRDLETLGYPWASAWETVEALLGYPVSYSPVRVRWYQLLSSLQATAARIVGARPGLAAKVRKLKLTTDVLLRD